MTAEATQGERRATAEVLGYINAATQRQIAALTATGDATELEHRTGLHRQCLPERHGYIIEACAHRCAAQCNDGVAAKAQRRAGDGHL